MSSEKCPLGEDCDLTLAWMMGAERAKDTIKAQAAEIERLKIALQATAEALVSQEQKCRILADEISRLRAATQWRPIESAPRDGRQFLVWDIHYGVRIGRAHIRADHDDWLSYMDAHKGSSKGGIRATHWQPMPLPPPPAMNQEGGE